MEIVFIRHSKTKFESTINSFLWNLSEEGVKLAQELSQNPTIKTIEQITYREKNRKRIGVVSHCNILSLFSSQYINKHSLDIHNSMTMPDFAILDWDSKKFINFFGDLK